MRMNVLPTCMTVHQAHAVAAGGQKRMSDSPQLEFRAAVRRSLVGMRWGLNQVIEKGSPQSSGQRLQQVLELGSIVF